LVGVPATPIAIEI